MSDNRMLFLAFLGPRSCDLRCNNSSPTEEEEPWKKLDEDSVLVEVSEGKCRSLKDVEDGGDDVMIRGQLLLL